MANKLGNESDKEECMCGHLLEQHDSHFKCKKCSCKMFEPAEDVEDIDEGIYKPGGGGAIGVSGHERRKVKCTKCRGTGNISKTSYVACPKCHGEGFTFEDPAYKGSSNDFDYFTEEGNTVAGIAGYNAPLASGKKKKTMKEMKSFKNIIKEVDLSTKEKSLSHFLSQASQSGELPAQFGPGFSSDKFVDWLKQKIEAYNLHVSDEFVNKMKKNLKDMNPMKAQAYVYNSILKGSGMGLTEARFKAVEDENNPGAWGVLDTEKKELVVAERYSKEKAKSIADNKNSKLKEVWIPDWVKINEGFDPLEKDDFQHWFDINKNDPELKKDYAKFKESGQSFEDYAHEVYDEEQKWQ